LMYSKHSYKTASSLPAKFCKLPRARRRRERHTNRSLEWTRQRAA
jgi:hypothetical protein